MNFKVDAQSWKESIRIGTNKNQIRTDLDTIHIYINMNIDINKSLITKIYFEKEY